MRMTCSRRSICSDPARLRSTVDPGIHLAVMSAASPQDAAMAQRIEQACLAMEQATDAATRTAADTFLQAFRDTPRPYTLCTLLLQGSAVANAQFIALATMKVAIQREGRVLGGATLAQLKDQLLNCLVMRANTWVSSKGTCDAGDVVASECSLCVE
jgi:hypothetical protein